MNLGQPSWGMRRRRGVRLSLRDMTASARLRGVNLPPEQLGVLGMFLSAPAPVQQQIIQQALQQGQDYITSDQVADAIGVPLPPDQPADQPPSDQPPADPYQDQGSQPNF